MEIKELKIQVPDGYEIDKENSTFEKIVFKKKGEEKWTALGAIISGYYIDNDANVIELLKSEQYYYCRSNYNIFATEKQAKSALAMARISQIMANDERFGRPITDNEWRDATLCKYVIDRQDISLRTTTSSVVYHFLAFHTKEQRDLFLKENDYLIKDYFMID